MTLLRWSGHEVGIPADRTRQQIKVPEMWVAESGEVVRAADDAYQRYGPGHGSKALLMREPDLLRGNVPLEQGV